MDLFFWGGIFQLVENIKILIIVLMFTLIKPTFGQGFPLVLQAENMEVKTSGSAISGGWLLDTNGWIATSINFPETRKYSFEIQVKGTMDYDEWPFMELRIDNLVAGPIIVERTSWGSYKLAFKVSQGTHQLAIAFVNDSGGRELYIDKITIEYSNETDHDILLKLANSIMAKRPDPQNYSLTNWRILDIMYGIAKTYDVTGDVVYLNYIKSWIDNHIDEDGNLDITIKGSIPGMLLVWLYDITGESKYLNATIKITNYMLTVYPRTTNGGYVHEDFLIDQLWIDTIGSHGLLWGHMGHVTGQGIYFNEGNIQIFAHMSVMQDASTGLVYHGWDEDGSASWADPITHTSPCFWARGNGWVARALTDFLEYLPETNPSRAAVILMLQNFVNGVSQTQDDVSGLWFTIMDEAEQSDNYLETTASALFAYGLQKAMNFGWISNSYQACVTKTNEALNRKIYVDPDNNVIVTGVSQGTSVGDYNYYVTRYVRTGDDYSYGEGVFLQTKAVLVGDNGSSTYGISGKTRYYSNNNPIQNVEITIKGDQTTNLMTGASGDYQAADLQGNQDYTIKATKPADSDIGVFSITAYDASLTAQAAIGLKQLTQDEAIAADVSKNDVINAYDASLIAQYAVKLPKPSASHVGEWYFSPDSVLIQPLNSDLTNQDFTGIILGDVDGGWAQPSGLLGKKYTTKQYEKLKDIVVNPGDELTIPLEIESNNEVIAAEIDVEFSVKSLHFIDVQKTNLSKNMELFFNNESNRLRIVAFGVEPVNGSGVLVKIRFRVKAQTAQSSNFLLNKFTLNDKIFMQAKSTITICEENKIPSEFKLNQNYPNPFSPGKNLNNRFYEFTNIGYQLAAAEEVSLKIYNYLGQEVRTIVSSKKVPGSYKAFWDGRDNNGNVVLPGIYLYRIKAGNFIKTKRMIIL